MDWETVHNWLWVGVWGRSPDMWCFQISLGWKYAEPARVNTSIQADCKLQLVNNQFAKRIRGSWEPERAHSGTMRGMGELTDSGHQPVGRAQAQKMTSGMMGARESSVNGILRKPTFFFFPHYRYSLSEFQGP